MISCTYILVIKIVSYSNGQQQLILSHVFDQHSSDFIPIAGVVSTVQLSLLQLLTSVKFLVHHGYHIAPSVCVCVCVCVGACVQERETVWHQRSSAGLSGSSLQLFLSLEAFELNWSVITAVLQ